MAAATARKRSLPASAPAWCRSLREDTEARTWPTANRDPDELRSCAGLHEAGSAEIPRYGFSRRLRLLCPTGCKFLSFSSRCGETPCETAPGNGMGDVFTLDEKTTVFQGVPSLSRG